MFECENCGARASGLWREHPIHSDSHICFSCYERMVTIIEVTYCTIEQALRLLFQLRILGMS